MKQHLEEHAKQINEAVSAIIEMEGMKAENAYQIACGAPPKYLQNDFDRLIENYELGYNGCIEKSKKFK